MDTFTQTHRLFELADFGFGPDAFVVTGLSGSERVSAPFHFELELLSTEPAADPERVLGQSVGLTAQLGIERPLHGVVSRFEWGEMGPRQLRRYHMTLVPWLALLEHTSQCRIFQQKTAKEIISSIFDQYRFGPYRYLAAPGAKREYCVQFNESDFAFVSRLLEEEGACYFFEFSATGHTLVIADRNQLWPATAETDLDYGQELAPYSRITGWRRRHGLRPGNLALNDYDFTKPPLNLLAKRESGSRIKHHRALEHYSYPGYHDLPSARDIVKLRLEAQEAQRQLIQGEGNCASFAAGHRFSLAKHHDAGECGEYLLLAVEHSAADTSFYAGAEGSTHYLNRFEALPASIAYRPPRQFEKPRLHSLQSATVVGPAGEEIYKDALDRVKVQFHWDREGKRNEHSSCFVRVASAWAGNGWGTSFTPRIGQEVLVAFIDGDPDRPVITGAVYNGDNAPVFASKTQSGVRSRSTKGTSAQNFNELRFDDQRGAEEVYLRAERDFNAEVGRDQTLKVARDRDKAIEGEQRERVGKDMKVAVGGNLTETVGGDYSEDVKGAELHRARTITLEAAETITLRAGGAEITLKQNGDITIRGATIKVTGSGDVILRGAKVLAN